MGRACLFAMPEDEEFYLMQSVANTQDDWIKINRDLDKAFKDYQDFGYCFQLVNGIKMSIQWQSP